MVLNPGALIYINYTAKIKDTGEVIETTWEEEAKKYGIYKPGFKYAPRLIAVNEGWILKGVDEALLKAKVGERITVEIPPEKGFGLRDPNKIRLIPLRKFGEKASQIKVGDEVEIDGKIGIVRFIGSGRVQIDFNHKLAGKTLVYEIEILKELTEDEEKIRALLARRFGTEEGKFNIKLEDKRVIIRIPEELFFLEGIQFIKKASSSDIFKYVKNIKEVIFQELFRAEESQTTPTEEAKS